MSQMLRMQFAALAQFIVALLYTNTAHPLTVLIAASWAVFGFCFAGALIATGDVISDRTQR